MSSWNDFNDAQSQNLIPKGAIAKVRLTIRPGGYNDEQQGWTGGYATFDAIALLRPRAPAAGPRGARAGDRGHQSSGMLTQAWRLSAQAIQ